MILGIYGDQIEMYYFLLWIQGGVKYRFVCQSISEIISDLNKFL